MNNFDLKNFLTENKLTSNSKTLSEKTGDLDMEKLARIIVNGRKVGMLYPSSGFDAKEVLNDIYLIGVIVKKGEDSFWDYDEELETLATKEPVPVDVSPLDYMKDRKMKAAWEKFGYALDYTGAAYEYEYPELEGYYNRLVNVVNKFPSEYLSSSDKIPALNFKEPKKEKEEEDLNVLTADEIQIVKDLMDKYKDAKDGRFDFLKFLRQLRSKLPVFRPYATRDKGASIEGAYTIDNTFHPDYEIHSWGKPDQVIHKSGPGNKWIFKTWKKPYKGTK